MITLFLIFLNIIIYFITPYSTYGLFGLNILFFKGNYWQILSSMFLHAGLTHLILNMIVLFQFGSILEKYLGKVYFLLIYFVGGILCSLLSAVYIYFFDSSVNLIGASGAICVLMGYFAFLDRKSTLGIIIAILLMSFIPLMMGVNIAWYGHIFGFICGFILAKTMSMKKRCL
ncbi:rhomboid family intramembrane serine protease [Campylobacter molothri]|uniref:Rhomboid family intramembrane serine protease n=1 Tax=Campylobacter molothri TaxID=1032242 RepID=A0ACC5W0H2_9BACT|nr:rhomboid family intramembrane serine protease [Campylobacter sp. RM10542]MBZ7957834.1 rhomboid family intramembrane serine protease [Campylobacter sp. RM9760]MBZ7973970.1 rhomboid family intramembrane serine protease [Campylobacter sp. RM9754]